MGDNTLIKNNRIKENVSGGIVFLIVTLVEFVLTLPISSIMNNSSEYNVTAMAACLSGYDWSNTIAKNYYYGFTTSVLFSTVFKIPFIAKNPQLLLHALLLINIIINAACAVILFKIVVQISKKENNYVFAALLSVATSLLLSCQVLSKAVTNENVLVLSFFVCIYLLLRINKTNKVVIGLIYAIIIAMFCLVAYATNGRGVIIIAMSAIVLIYNCIRKKKKAEILELVAFFAVLLVGYLGVKYLKRYFVGSFFSTGPLKNNDVSGLIDRALDLINLSGVLLYIRLLIGWGWYFIVSTYGLGIIAVVSAIRIVLKKFKKEEVNEDIFIVSSIVLMFIGIMSVIGVSFYHDSFIDMFAKTGELANGRVDKLIYGRYISTIKPIIIAYAIVAMIDYFDDVERQKILQTVIVLFPFWFVAFMKMINPYMIRKTYAAVDIPEFAIFWLSKMKEDFKFGIVPEMGNLLVGAFTALIFLGLVILLNKRKIYPFVISIIIVNLILGSLYTFVMMKPRADFYRDKLDSEVVEYINSVREDNSVILITEQLGYLYQFELADVMVCNKDTFFDKYEEEDYKYIFLLNEDQELVNKIQSDGIIVEY